ncbi:MAG: SpoIVB peptidase S55 domain-containing protein [Bacillota bacterium]
MHEHQMIVLTPGNPANKIIAGMSGSPVVQNGKLIGMLAMRVQAPQQTENYGLARLAADIYVSTEGYFDWDPAGSGLIAYDPNRHWSEELAEAAHAALAEHYELDLTVFQPLEGWHQPAWFSYTPAFSGSELVALCIQDAQQQHGRGATIPPLVLLDEESNCFWWGSCSMIRLW